MSIMNDAGWQRFLELCCDSKQSSPLNELLQLLLTVEERHAIALRVALIRELLSGEKTQREIAADLEVSIAKITRGSNALKQIDDTLRRFLLAHL
jgi:TrpR family trp operon transcriptional repressor